MEFICLYFFEEGSKEKPKEFNFAIADWYAKPEILSCICFKFQAKFLCCSKYGCRQFLPKFSKSFPVHTYDLYY